MKKAILALLLYPLVALSQKEASQIKAYGAIQAVTVNYAKSDPAFGGIISFGGRRSLVGLGGGFGVISLPNSSSAYVPVFGELSIFSNHRKIRPYFNVRGGYGIYQNSIAGINETGGLFLSSNLGLLFPMKGRMAFLLSAGYINSTFTIDATRFTDRVSNQSGAWTAGLGFKF